jgi:hypothetical protein
VNVKGTRETEDRFWTVFRCFGSSCSNVAETSSRFLISSLVFPLFFSIRISFVVSLSSWVIKAETLRLSLSPLHTFLTLIFFPHLYLLLSFRPSYFSYVVLFPYFFPTFLNSFPLSLSVSATQQIGNLSTLCKIKATTDMISPCLRSWNGNTYICILVFGSPRNGIRGCFVFYRRPYFDRWQPQVIEYIKRIVILT